MSKKPTGPVVVNPERLAEKLYQAACEGSDARAVALTALCTAQIMLGMGDELHGLSMQYLAEGAERVKVLNQLWEIEATQFPYLRGNIHPLVSWMENPTDRQCAASDACFKVLMGVDIKGSMEAVGGDLIGQTYTWIMSPADRKAGQKFYTPMSVSKLIAAMNQVEEWQSVSDPCCGSGGMPLAVFYDLTERGLDPRTVTYVMQDIDPIGVALAGVNFASRGVPFVELTCGNSLGPPVVPNKKKGIAA